MTLSIWFWLLHSNNFNTNHSEIKFEVSSCFLRFFLVFMVVLCFGFFVLFFLYFVLQFLNEHGGSSNAFTSNEHTNFYFDVSPDNLAGALER